MLGRPSRTTVIFVAIVVSMPVMTICTVPITRRAAINPRASAAARRRFRGAKRGANARRHQATPGDNQPWFPQLDRASGHTQPHAATRRMRLKSGRSAVRPRP
jgi:hypothetical protein